MPLDDKGNWIPFLPLVERDKKAKEEALEWIDARIHTLVSDKDLISHESALNTVETAIPFVEQMSDHWVDDLEEVGRRLSIFARECKKYHGKWDSKKLVCRR